MTYQEIEAEEPDLYMASFECATLETVRDELNMWSNQNKHDLVFKSHSVCVVGMTYLLTIVYHYK